MLLLKCEDYYERVISLAESWEDSFTLFEGNIQDLTGLHVRMQLRTAAPTLPNPAPPVLEITTPGYYATNPGWTVLEAFSIPTPTNGIVLLQVNPSDFAEVVSPTNAKMRYLLQALLVNKDSGDIESLFPGRVTFKPAVTV